MVPLLLVFVGATFLASGFGKLRADGPAAGFLLDIGVPRPLVRPVDRAVSLVEVALGLLLLSGRMVRWSAGTAVVLSAAFLAAHIVARVRGSSASCGCFGAMDSDLRPVLSLLRTALFLGITAALATGLYAGVAAAGVPVGHLQAVLGGVLSCATYLLAFRLLNETAVLIHHDRERHRRLLAMADRVDST